jgi:hypothetical protein
MKYIENSVLAEPAGNDDAKYRQYLDSFRPFFTRIVEESHCEAVRVDRALWVFGKALKLPIIKKLAGLG